jgi:hypothetical protein
MRLVLSATLALLSGLLECRDINSPVQGVGIELAPNGAQLVFLDVGDVDTVRARAYVGGWPSIVKYDSDTVPELFQYSSSAPQVAQIDRRGVVTAISPGATILHASVEGVQSAPLPLTISLPAARLLAEPTAISARVGDTLTITVTAVDGSGRAVTGVPFSIFPDTTWWAVVSPPVEGAWNLRTPLVLHPRAKMSGSVKLLAVSLHEPSAESLRAIPVAVAVRAP